MNAKACRLVIAGSSVIAVASGIIFYGLSVFTTPMAVVAGAFVHGLVVATQRWMGIRVVPTPISSATAAS